MRRDRHSIHYPPFTTTTFPFMLMTKKKKKNQNIFVSCRLSPLCDSPRSSGGRRPCSPRPRGRAAPGVLHRDPLHQELRGRVQAPAAQSQRIRLLRCLTAGTRNTNTCIIPIHVWYRRWCCFQVHPCNEKPCPINCHWGSWTPWTVCHRSGHVTTTRRRRRRDATADADVAGGYAQAIAPDYALESSICTQSRQRIIEVPPAHYGKDCKGEYTESRFCQSYECQGERRSNFWPRKFLKCMKKKYNLRLVRSPRSCWSRWSPRLSRSGRTQGSSRCSRKRRHSGPGWTSGTDRARRQARAEGAAGYPGPARTSWSSRTPR